MDPGLTTDSELRKWGDVHRPLWAALREQTFAVQVVAIGTDEPAADRAETVLRYWAGGGERPAEADPDIQQEITILEWAFVQGERHTLHAFGGSRRRRGGSSHSRNCPPAPLPQRTGAARLTAIRRGARVG